MQQKSSFRFTMKSALLLLLVAVLVVGSVCLPLSTIGGEGKVAQAAMTAGSADKPAKYVFLFIGDGMAHVQVNAAQVYQGNQNYGEIAVDRMSFTQFPVAGVQLTQDSTSFCPDSASTATSISSGYKTHSGVIGLGPDKEVKNETMAETAHKQGKKVGIISSVTLNHATPAAFYAHVNSRGEYYTIGEQMAASGFDYFAGGSLGSRTGKEKDQKDLYDVLKEKGYTITETKDAFKALKKGDEKVYAVSPRLQDSGSMPYTIDQQKDDITLADFTKKGIELLDNPNGFFMMIESGKIDWACHANDAATTIHEVQGLNDSVKVALDFYKKHPEETLILVTGDHETGGLTIGQAGTGYDTAFSLMQKQTMSYVAFDDMFSDLKEKNPQMTMKDVYPIIEKVFALKAKGDEKDPFVLTAYEQKQLERAFAESMKAEDKRMEGQEADILYGGYEPLTVTITHLLNQKAGVGWTSYAHTGVPVAVYGIGARADLFNGYYDNTAIYTKVMEAMGMKAGAQ